MKRPFVNAHTHRPSRLGELGVLNCLPEDNIPEDLFSVGMHPWYIEEERALEQFKLLKKKALIPNCLAIGECGFDRMKGPPMDVQMYWIEQQATLAMELNKPIIIHCVKAFDVLAGWLKKTQLSVPCIIHGFRKKPEVLQQLLRFNCFFSFGRAGLEQETSIKSFQQLHSQQFLLETDDDAQDIEAIYQQAAQLRQLTLTDLKALQINNFQRIFNYDIS